MNRKLKIGLGVFAGIMLVGTACGNNGDDPRSLAKDFIHKYEAEFKALGSAFGEDLADFENTDAAIADADPTEFCDRPSEDDAGAMTFFLGPLFAEHGHSVVGFLADWNGVVDAAEAAGWCGAV